MTFSTKRSNTTQRGYGATHHAARTRAFKQLPEWSPCARCHQPMWKHAKTPNGKSAIHWDHNDQRDGYLGFSHKRCNESAAGAKGGRMRVTNWRSRNW